MTEKYKAFLILELFSTYSNISQIYKKERESQESETNTRIYCYQLIT